MTRYFIGKQFAYHYIEKPACGNCIKGNKECVYIDISGRNAAVRKDKVQKLEERIRRSLFHRPSRYLLSQVIWNKD